METILTMAKMLTNERQEFKFIRKTAENIFFVALTQRIPVILIQRNDGYFIPEISILRTFGKRNF